MKKEKSVLHLCEGTLLALVSLLIMDLYLLKFLQDPEAILPSDAAAYGGSSGTSCCEPWHLPLSRENFSPVLS